LFELDVREIAPAEGAGHGGHLLEEEQPVRRVGIARPPPATIFWQALAFFSMMERLPRASASSRANVASASARAAIFTRSASASACTIIRAFSAFAGASSRRDARFDTSARASAAFACASFSHAVDLGLRRALRDLRLLARLGARDGERRLCSDDFALDSASPAIRGGVGRRTATRFRALGFLDRHVALERRLLFSDRTAPSGSTRS
jgi:hypothetical protein